MKARITPAEGQAFHLEWKGGRVIADAASAVALRCTEYLNGTPKISCGEPHEGGTDGHYTEQRALLNEMEFLLIVGSLFDRFDVYVDLVGD